MQRAGYRHHCRVRRLGANWQLVRWPRFQYENSKKMEENPVSPPWISGLRTETGPLADWKGLEHEKGIRTEDIAWGPQKVLASLQERRKREGPRPRQLTQSVTHWRGSQWANLRYFYKDSSQQKSEIKSNSAQRVSNTVLNIFKILVYQDAKKYYYENVPYSERNIGTLD